MFFSLKIFSNNLEDQNNYKEIKNDLSGRIEKLSRATGFK